MNKRNRKIFSTMVIRHDSTWASVEEMIVWIDQITNSVYQNCANIALALDSNRGNEKEIAKSIIGSKEEQGKQEQPVKVRVLGVLEYLRMLKKNKGIMSGDVWLREPNNPFDKSPVTVLDVKDGYILYKYSTGGTSTETIGSFKRLYTKE